MPQTVLKVTKGRVFDLYLKNTCKYSQIIRYLNFFIQTNNVLL